MSMIRRGRCSSPSLPGRRLSGSPLILLPLVVVLAGCWDLKGGPSGPALSPPAAVVVEPSEVDLVPGQQTRLEARVLDGDGSVIRGVPVEWTTSDATVVRVLGNSGRIRGVGEGTAVVTARISHPLLGSLEGSATVRVEGPPVEPRTLTVVRQGGGLVYTDPPGIRFEPVLGFLSDTATANYAPGTVVDIIAEESIGFFFPEFSGEGCSGSTCRVTMTEDRQVTVRFSYREAQSEWVLRGAGTLNARGSVELPSQGGWSCGPPDDRRFCNRGLIFRPWGLEITNEATPEPGWRFREWEGECTHGDPVCIYTVAGFLTRLTAVFEPEPSGGFTTDELWPRFGDDISLEFTAPAGGPEPDPLVHRFNEAPALSIHPVHAVFSIAASWLTGMVEEDGDEGILTVTASTADLAPGVYTTSFFLYSWKAFDHPLTVDVTLTVTP